MLISLGTCTFELVGLVDGGTGCLAPVPLSRIEMVQPLSSCATMRMALSSSCDGFLLTSVPRLVAMPQCGKRAVPVSDATEMREGVREKFPGPELITRLHYNDGETYDYHNALPDQLGSLTVAGTSRTQGSPGAA